MYVASQQFSGGIQIVDISNPTAPLLLGSVAAGTGAEGIYATGKYVYVAASTALVVIDVSNPNSPFIAGSITSGTALQSVYVSGKYAYVADETSSNEFKIYDISNPASIKLVSQTSTSTANMCSVYVQGTYAYLVTGTDLEVFDITNPIIPVNKSQRAYNGTCGQAHQHEVTVQGRYAYTVSDTGTGGATSIQIFDVSNPSSIPAAISTTATAQTAVSIAVSGRYAYVGEWNPAYVEMCDIQDPNNVQKVSTVQVDASQNPVDVEVSGRYLYASFGSSPDAVLTYQLQGIETATLTANDAEIGGLQIDTNATIANALSVGTNVNVGWGGIFSQGQIAGYNGLSINGKVTGQALNIFNETGDQDIFTASASGITKFLISNSGTTVIGSGVTSSDALSQSGLTIKQQGKGNSILVVNQLGLGDILTASASGVAKFTISNSGAASQSGSLTMDTAGSIQTTKNQTLTIGGGTTGNIVIDAATASQSIAIGATSTALSFGASNTASTLNMGTGTGANVINIGTGATLTGITNTIHIGDGTPAGTGLTNITIGNALNTGALTLKSGSGNITIGSNAGNGTVVISPNAGGQAALIINKQADLGMVNPNLFVASSAGILKFAVDSGGNATASGGLTVGGLVGLSTSSSGSDPIGFAGAMYYNSSLTHFRCFTSSWVSCDSTSATQITFNNVIAATADQSIDNGTNQLVWSNTGKTTGIGLTINGDATMTTGGLLSLSSSTYVHTVNSGEAGSVARINFTDHSSDNNAVTTTTNGLVILTTVDTTGSGTKSINAINTSAPSITGCGTGNCVIDGLLTHTLALGNAATITSNGIDIQTTKITLVNLNGINISNVAAGGSNQNAIQIGTGWNKDIFFITSTTGSTHAFTVKDQATAATAGDALSFTAGLGNTTGNGGAITVTSGGSGSGATGNGGALTFAAGAANSTNGTGGLISITSGVGTGTGASGAVTLQSGTVGASCTSGAVTLDIGTGV